ncbi:glycosyltransferase [Streptomyces luomodiensis]|uniref:Glycosyltransferase n=1 Tax=Streptomyces luomodiensis TaxID=3026192 RepID=A0ABY9UMV1_9ACTN|nr:glycosyltransferase [Streptomyces sp. SCA4-21]WNE93867.1 glycosyltransferase [Streptomyces sp. SCA4-21]
MTAPRPTTAGAGGGVRGRLSSVSVVVPTLGHPDAVRRLLDSLNAAITALPSGMEAEVLIVDDSQGTDREGIQEACRATGATYLRGPRNVGAKRNTGVAHCRFPLVLFIDSDCVATPSLLSAHIDAHNEHRATDGASIAAVAGPTVVEGAGQVPAWRTVQHSVVVNAPWNWPLHYDRLWWGATSNLSVRKDAFEEISGFDEHPYTVVGGEDVDLGVRLHAAGHRILGHPRAVVMHATDGITRLSQFHRKLFLYGRACVYNCVRQPQYASWSFNPVSAAVALTVAAALLPGARRKVSGAAAAVLASWFVRDTVRLLRRSRPEEGLSVGRLLGLAVAATSVDWSYHVGITREAIVRGRPLLTMKRFNYFPPHLFRPASSPAEPNDPRGQERNVS